MKKIKFSVIAVCLVLAGLLLQIALPLVNGESPVELGVDLSGGAIVHYRPDFSGRLDAFHEMPREELLLLAKETLASRLSRSFSTIPEIVVRGDQAIVVTIPSRLDQGEVLELIGKTYHLTLRLVEGEASAGVAPGSETFEYEGRRLVLGDPVFSGDMLDVRTIGVDTRQSVTEIEPASARVTFGFEAPHDSAFAEFTGNNAGRMMAILIDDQVEWAGRIEGEIRGTGTLHGNYTFDEASEIAAMLRSGTLPMGLEVESVEAVGPSLGQEIRDLGLQALLLAVGLLTLIVGLAYRRQRDLLVTGLVSLACLLVLLVGMIAVFDLTLDLVGIAGIVLSVGMGMDAFIIVFESLSNTQHQPRQAPRRQLIRRAYSFRGDGRALFHANLTTLVVVLLLLGNERLKSFAIFIFVGLVASAATIGITRWVLTQMERTFPNSGSLSSSGGLRSWRPRIFRFRWAYGALVAVLLTAATVSWWQSPESLRFGADFQPGSQVTVTAAPEQLTPALDALAEGLPDVSLRHQILGAPEDQRHLVTLGATLTVEKIQSLVSPATTPSITHAELAAVLNEHGVAIEGTSSIDSKVSSRRLLGSLTVLGFSFVLLALYFAAQTSIEGFFSSQKPQAGPVGQRLRIFGAVLGAVVLDVAVVVASLVFLKIPINLPVVAALLTIIGYSVNDSVVLWSHVEKYHRESGEAVLEAVTRGVDSVLSRTVLTSLSTMVPALTILWVGLNPLADFARVMLVGTAAGTLSSIFVVGAAAVGALRRGDSGVAKEARPQNAGLVQQENGLVA